MEVVHNLGKEIEGQVELRIALLKGKITVLVLAELLTKERNGRYRVSEETMRILSANKLVDPRGNIYESVLKAVVKIRDMTVEIPELKFYDFE